MRHVLVPAAIAAVLAASPAIAQERLPLPADALVRVSCDTPPKLEQAFDGTRVGALLASSEFDDIWQSVKDAFERDLADQPDEQMPPQVERILELIEQTPGRFTWALEMDVDFDIESDVPPIGFALAFESDDTEALDEIQRLVMESAEEEEEPMLDVEVEGQAFVKLVAEEEEGREFAALLPVRMGNALVMFAGLDIEERTGKWMRAAQESAEAGETEDATSPFEAYLDLERCVTMMSRLLEDEAPPPGAEFGGMGGPDFGALVENMRLKGLREMRLTLAPDQERALMDVAITFDPQRSTILDIIRPREDGKPALLSVAPRNHESWSLSFVRVDELTKLLVDIAGTIMPSASMEMVEESFGEQFEGMSLQNDLLAHIGDEVLMLSDPEASAEAAENPMSGGVDGIAFAIEMKDPSAFAASIDQMLRTMGMHAARSTEEYRGLETFEMPLMGLIPLTWAYGADFFVLGIGSAGGDQARIVLDAEVARREGEEPPPFSEDVQNALDAMPQRWSAVSVSDLVPQLQTAADMAELGDADLPPEFGDALRSLAGLVEQHGLATTVSTTTFSEGRMLLRVVW